LPTAMDCASASALCSWLVNLSIRMTFLQMIFNLA
jgi:hypothetical protein